MGANPELLLLSKRTTPTVSTPSWAALDGSVRGGVYGLYPPVPIPVQVVSTATTATAAAAAAPTELVPQPAGASHLAEWTEFGVVVTVAVHGPEGRSEGVGFPAK